MIADKVLVIIVALLVGGWASGRCKKNKYTARESFLYGSKIGLIVAVFIVIFFLMLKVFGFSQDNGHSFLKGFFIVVLVGLSYGFYCWERAIKDGR